MDNFADKTVVITGAASGIGRALAESFGREEANVVLTDVEQGALNATVEELRADGLKASGVVMDVSDFDSVSRAANRIEELHGNVHILFNNAGVGAFEDLPIWELPLNDWHWTLNVNVWGVIHCIKAFLPAMLAHGEEGHVVNTSSGNGGLTLLPSTPIYATSKSAVSTITEALHLQLLQRGARIHASVLYPGPNMVTSNIFTAYRNRPEALVREQAQATPPSLEDIKGMAKQFGQELQTTEPAEVAEYAVAALKKNSFWILPMSKDTEGKLRERLTDILERRDPQPPNSFF